MEIGEVTVLIVDDEPKARAAMRRALRPLALRVLEAGNGAEALRIIQHEQPHATLLDLGLPDVHGVEVLRRVRRDGYLGAVIAVTGDATARTQKRAIANKVDDYLTKPFGNAGLRDRLLMVLRRTRSFGAPLRRPRLELDSARQTLRIDDRAVTLTETETRLLDCVLSNAGAVVAYDALLAQLDTPRLATLQTHISRIRAKLGRYGSYLKTVPRQGYCLDPAGVDPASVDPAGVDPDGLDEVAPSRKPRRSAAAARARRRGSPGGSESSRRSPRGSG